VPNWCENNLTVKGKKSDLEKFEKKARNKEEVFSLNNFIPMPEELNRTSSPTSIVSAKEYKEFLKKQESEQKDKKSFIHYVITKKMSKDFIEKYGYDNWYDWRICNWGIKWDVSATSKGKNKNKLTYYFDSPWGPPIIAMEKISKLFPALYFTFSYDEPGMNYKGSFSVKNGKLKTIS